MTLNSIPSRPPNDGSLTGGTWSFLRAAQAWMYKISAPQVSQTASATVSNLFFYPFDATSGNLVATLPLASSCLGKVYVIKKTDSSAHTVTVTPSGADVIDGAATKVLSTQYQTVYLISDGVSNWWLLTVPGAGGSNPVATVITATGAFTYNVPTGTNCVLAIYCGGGGAGGSSSAAGVANGAGGGSAETARTYIPVTSGGTLTGSVGAGGLAGATGAAGNPGTDTTVGSLTAAHGLGGASNGSGGVGGGRLGGAAGAVGSPGGAGTAGTAEGFNSVGGSGGGGSATSNTATAGGKGGASENNAAVAGGTAGVSGGGGSGGSSPFGPGGAGSNGGSSSTGGTPAAGSYGAGGGGCGSKANGVGGAGANGVVIIIPQ